jgi:hypothetical protein
LQADADLLDLLFLQERAQIAQYTAILDRFDDAAFSEAGFPAGSRDLIATILAADEAHRAVLERPGRELPPAETIPPPTDIAVALREAVELENLAVAVYAFVIPELPRPRLLRDLLGIHSVDARHATWLATMIGLDPFPNAIDPEFTPGEPSAGTTEPGATPVADGAGAAALAAIRRELGLEPDAPVEAVVTPEVWPDSSLGCPQPGMAYAQVVTEGYIIEVEVEGERIEFHADQRGTVVRCP